jgi:hypothetical protein
MQTHTHKPWNLAPARRRKGHVPPPNGRGSCKFISGTIALFWGMPSPGSAWKLGSHRETVGAKLKENLGERPGVSHKGKIDRRSIEPFKFALVKRPWTWRARPPMGNRTRASSERRSSGPSASLASPARGNSSGPRRRRGMRTAVRLSIERCGCAMPVVARCMASVMSGEVRN